MNSEHCLQLVPMHANLSGVEVSLVIGWLTIPELSLLPWVMEYYEDLGHYGLFHLT